MNSKRFVLILGIVLAAGFVSAAVGERPTAPRGRAAEARPKRLVRLDLLQPGEPKLLPERRNIFIGSAGSPDADVHPAPGRGRLPGAANPGEAETTEVKPDIRYIGCVVSPRGIIGLVLVEGSAQSVTPGEAMRPGYTVTRLTRTEVEITGPDGVPKTYSLQGVEE